MNKRYLFLLVLVAFLVFPIKAFALFEGPIVPCGGSEGPECTLCHIFELGKNIIDFIKDLIIVIAPIFILGAGLMILISAGNPKQLELGKTIIKNTIIGIIIYFLAWTLINTVFNAFIGSEGFPWPWNEVHCSGGEVNEVETPTGEDVPSYGENRCDSLSAAAACFGGLSYCQVGVVDQIGDASAELRSLINCVNSKILDANARVISSITDNSGGRCFDDWNSQCSSGIDSCEGICCGHSQNSLHYGGSGCRGISYAVDFANETYGVEIMEAVKACAVSLSLGTVDVISEGDHIHVELDQVAREKGCL